MNKKIIKKKEVRVSEKGPNRLRLVRRLSRRLGCGPETLLKPTGKVYSLIMGPSLRRKGVLYAWPGLWCMHSGIITTGNGASEGLSGPSWE
jgi:hypothetical protein